jgi:hypothetical protein
MTSAQTSFPHRLTKIDPITCGHHSYLNADDECYFLGEYTARKGFSHSATNNLIINFKKPLDRRGLPQWKHKASKITEAANALHNALMQYDLRSTTFVPVPPSKAKGDPMYDDRMSEMLRQLSELFRTTAGYALDVREVVIQRQSTEAAHDAHARPSPEQLAGLYDVDSAMLADSRPHVLICDDVLTTGSHFKAMCKVLSGRMPEVLGTTCPRSNGLFCIF